MAESVDPAVQRLALRLQLRQLRVGATLTQKDVAKQLEWSPSKILRIESGENGVSATDLQALLRIYKVTDPRRTEELTKLAREGRKPSTSSYDDVLSKEIQLLQRYEKAASIIRQFEPIVVPGLLQTREYAESILRLYASPDDSERVIQRRIESRLERQELLERDDPPEMFFILDEAAVRRRIGYEAGGDAGRSVMRQQIEYLKKINEHPRITIQIMRFLLGGYQGMRGPFVVIEFAEAALNDLLYLETVDGEYIKQEEPSDTRPYLEQFWEMESVATAKDELNDLLDDVLRSMDSDEAGEFGSVTT
ncbi:helix-turn-helix domain-containing protein [Paractinoplanes globisporus]|uniref:Helix-turn-helix domain-containing protein n=1 Tax=Paractinoplanes globisporus TaxID=113565 RepID=A0ABW6WVN4_9ACTN|nr:helix-turn-helix transcriptional regulator [Actinoplanes globisporus]